MKRFFSVVITICLFCFLASTLAAQEAAEVSSLVQLDAEVGRLGNIAGERLAQLPSGSKIKIDSFRFMGSVSPLGRYWQNHLQSVLVEKAGGAYVVLDQASGQRGAYTVSGEIQRLGAITRVYTKLTDTASSSIVNVWYTDLLLSRDFERTVNFTMPQESADGSASEMTTAPDVNEPDSMEEPMPCELDMWIQRSLHRGDADWFIVTAQEVVVMTASTSGDVDTKMVLYDADSRSELDEDDDGGSDTNASITWSAEAGKSYLIKVSGYDRSETGPYGFRVNVVTR